MSTAGLSPLDQAFLALERLAPMHLGAVVVLGDAAIGAHDLAEVLARRAERVTRLRHRLRPGLLPFTAATWADTPDFTARRHVHVHPPITGRWLELPR